MSHQALKFYPQTGLGWAGSRLRPFLPYLPKKNASALTVSLQKNRKILLDIIKNIVDYIIRIKRDWVNVDYPLLMC
jgi:hypothetical protein